MSLRVHLDFHTLLFEKDRDRPRRLIGIHMDISSSDIDRHKCVAKSKDLVEVVKLVDVLALAASHVREQPARKPSMGVSGAVSLC